MRNEKNGLKVYKQSEGIWYAAEFADGREYTVYYNIDHNIGYPEWNVYDDKGDEVCGPLRDELVDSVCEYMEKEENH